MTNPNAEPQPTPLRIARRAAHLSIAQLAVKAGIAVGTCFLADARGYMSKTTATKVARVLRVDPSSLLPKDRP